MAVRVLFLGPLADIAGMPETNLPAPLNWSGLLAAVNDATAAQLRQDKVKLACAGTIVADKTLLMAADGEEVALLPPVSGG